MKYKKFIVFISIIFLIALFIYLYLPGYSRCQALKAKELSLELKIKDLKEKNSEIVEELNLLKTDVTYLEQVMRNELGLVKPGEVVYKVVVEPNLVESTTNSNLKKNDN